MLAELFEPAEYLDQYRPGYFSIFAKPKGNPQQKSYELQHLPTIIQGLNPGIDTYITQAVFDRPNRRAVNVESVGLIFADLDTYHIQNLEYRNPEEQAWLLVRYCAENGIPAPSVVLFSGRGLQAKWFLTEPILRNGLMEWNAVQLGLVKALDDFGSDMKAKDVSRVLRLDKTVNTKSGERCRVVYVHSGVEAVTTRYDFEELRALFDEREEQAPKRIIHKSPPKNVIQMRFNERTLNWSRLEDLRTLWRLRGGVPEGYRETTLFWELNFLLRADPVRAQELYHEAKTLAAQIDPGAGFYQPSDLSTLYTKAQEHLAGVRIQVNGKPQSPLYSARNDTLLNMFKITPDEEQHMRTIISKDEKVRRRREQRRAAGMRPQEESEARLRPWEALGISRAWYYRLKAQGVLGAQ